MSKNSLYWCAFILSLLFGIGTFFYADKYPDDYVGVLSSIALCIVCAIKIYTQDDDEEADDEGGEF